MLSKIGIVDDTGEVLARVRETAPEDAVVVAVSPEDAATGMLAALAVNPAADGAAAAVRAAAAAQDTLIGLLADAIDCREGIAMGGSRRLCDHATRFAQALGLSLEDQFTLERGAMLHDIGKLCIPNDVLLKNTVLTYDEWMLVQRHTELGARLLRDRGFCPGVAEIVGGHHECYDGTGYPKGIERDAIPPFARIMKILDVYCAMTSPRHYRKTTSSHEDAVEHLASERGKHLDPDYIDVFLDGQIGQPPATTEP